MQYRAIINSDNKGLYKRRIC